MLFQQSKEKEIEQFLKLAGLLIVFAVALSACVGTAAASPPVVVNVQNTSYVYYGTLGTSKDYYTQLEATVTIGLSQVPSSSNYVDLIQVQVPADIAATFVSQHPTFNFTYDSPQTTNPFTVKLDIYSYGQVPTAAFPVAVRAHATQDGWSAWSQQISVPEFNFNFLTIITCIALAACELLLINRTKKFK